MPIDPSISLQVKPPQQEDLAANYIKLRSMLNVQQMQQAQLQSEQLKNQAAIRDASDDAAIRTALSSAMPKAAPAAPAIVGTNGQPTATPANTAGGIDYDKVIDDLAASGHGPAALKFQGALLKSRKEQADLAKINLENAQTKLETASQLLQGVKDESSFQVAKQAIGGIFGPQLTANLGDTYDPAKVAQAISWGQKTSDYVRAQHEALQDANKAIELAQTGAKNAPEIAERWTQAAGKSLSVASNSSEWQSTLQQLQKLGAPREVLAQFPAVYTPNAALQAGKMIMTPAERTTPGALSSMAAAGDAGAKATLQNELGQKVAAAGQEAEARVKGEMRGVTGNMGGATGASAPGAAPAAQGKPVAPAAAPATEAAPVNLPTPHGMVQAPAAAPRNEAVLQGVNPGTAATVKALVEGRMQFPAGFALKSPYWQNMINLVAQYDPSFDAVNYNSRAKTRMAFTSGAESKTGNAINTTIGHLGQLNTNIDKLGNFDSIPLLNTAANATKNWVKENSGYGGAINKFRTDVDAIASEATRVYRQAGGSEADIKAWKTNFSSSDSPKALRASLAELGDLLKSKLDALGQQYGQGMGTEPVNLLSPEAKSVLEKLTGASSATPPASAPATAAPKTGLPPVTIKLSSGRAVSIQ